jgi:hypothetical protein
MPVYAAAVTLDEKDIAGKLGLPAGTPLRVRGADKAAAIPLTRGTEEGRPVIRLYVSLKPSSRLDLVAERAEQWPEDKVTMATCEPSGAAAVMKNGVLRVTFGKTGWNLAFDAAETDKTFLVQDGTLDFWIDNQNRGRITNADPKELGLRRYANARLEKCEAAVGPDGRPAIRIVRRLDGFAKDMTVTETFELVPGMPVLICRIRWQNDGDAPLWVAYVGSGDGIRGKWAKPLMAGPLIERKKSPLQGDLGGGETRPAWLPQLCRISMESASTGCGVGMTTLLRNSPGIGQGSMIWGCGASGFQCNLIDPVQGQFPFLVKPHEALDNGFAFLAAETETSVYRQTAELWSALSSGKPPRPAPPCAVFVGREAVYAQAVSELGGAAGAADLLQADGAVRRAALRMDFNRYFECRLSVQAASPQDAVEITARPLAPGKAPVSLLRAEKAGEYKVYLNGRLGWTDETAFVLEAAAGGSAALKGLSIAEILPVSPDLLSPVAGASFTDIATMFRWKAIPLVVDYDVQWSRAEDFSSPVETRLSQSDPYPWLLPADDKLPAPGRWFWRVRGVKCDLLGEKRPDLLGQWSKPRSFTVSDDHSTRPVKRPLTAASPLFTLEATRVTDFTDFHPDVPADIAPYVGVIAEGFEGKGIPVTDFARGLEKLPHSIMLRSHWVGLADIEWLCQNVPNFIGIQGGEHLSDLYQDGQDGRMRYSHRLTRICAKYGMIYQEADGTYKDNKWQDLMDQQGAFIRQYGRYLVLTQKNNIIRRQFYSQSAAMGLWLGGITYQHGAWEDGGFYWQNAGFTGLGQCAGERRGVLRTMPRIFWDLVFVMGISRGCAMYSLDGQTLMFSPKEAERSPTGPLPSAIWDTTGRTSDTFKRFVVPLIRGVVQHGLIPTKEQVLQNVKLAVYNDGVKGDPSAWPYYVEYGPLYAATYGFRKMGSIDGQLWEFFPNTGRYYYIPALPQGNQPLGPGIRNLPLSELQQVARVKQIFDAAYPQWYEGDALVCRIGDTLTVQNSRENEDVTESYSVPLGGGWLKTLSGKVGPHAYLVGKIEDQGRRLWFQANTEYPERDTEVSILCSRKPEWQVEPAAAAKEAAWDDAAKSLKLRLSHHQGAVEVTVR